MRKPTISTDAAFGFATSRRILLGAVLVCALLALTMQAASAKTLKVDNGDPGCSNAPGSDPFCTNQAAIDDASMGDKIKVDDGTRSQACHRRWDDDVLNVRTVSVWPHVARPRLVRYRARPSGRTGNGASWCCRGPQRACGPSLCWRCAAPAGRSCTGSSHATLDARPKPSEMADAAVRRSASREFAMC